MDHFGPKIIVPFQGSGFTLKIFYNERGQEAYEIYIKKKDLVEGEWVIVGLKMLCPRNSGSALKDLSMILRNERVNVRECLWGESYAMFVFI